MLGEKIHQLRKGKGMSQEELASQLTVSRQAISKWELSESMPDTENVLQLGKLFNVSTDYLLNDEYENDTDIPAVKENSENLEIAYRKRVKKTVYWLIGIGSLGILTMWVLSFIIPVNEVRGDLTAFVITYNLSPIPAICCIMLLRAAVLLFSLRKKNLLRK